jgi:hypothetical protein
MMEREPNSNSNIDVFPIGFQTWELSSSSLTLIIHSQVVSYDHLLLGQLDHCTDYSGLGFIQFMVKSKKIWLTFITIFIFIFHYVFY